MSLRLFIDEDTQGKALVALLREAGHDLLTVNEAGMQGQDDHSILARAVQEQRLVLTQNCSDFQALHQADSRHLGILAIYKNPDPGKDMTHAEIIKAIANLEDSGWSLANQFVVLNAWNFDAVPPSDSPV